LVDTLGDFAGALGRMLHDLALPPIDATQIERMVGKGSEHLLRSVLNHVLAPMDEAQRAIKIEALFAQAWSRQLPGTLPRHQRPVCPGVPRCGPGFAGAACAWPAPGLSDQQAARVCGGLVARQGAGGDFEHVFGGDSFERKKPDPLPLRKTCEALGTQPARTLMVGDSSNDAQAARAAGCPVVLVTYGYNHGQDARSVDADGWVDSLAQLA